MSQSLPIPSPDPIPVPGDLGFILFLLYLTFFVHIVLMNALLGGLFLTLVSELLSRFSRDLHIRQRHEHLAAKLSRLLPFAVSLTITFGIAPLLFVQTVYGQFFYTSSVLMAWIWLSVVFLLVAAYYSLYMYTRGFVRWAHRRYLFISVSLVLFAAVAFIYVNNLTLMQTPQKWLEIYTRTQGSGWHWNLDEATLWPRYLHVILAAVAVAGMWTLVLGMSAERRDQAQGRFLKRWGAQWFLGATLLQVGVGLWFYYAIPEDLRAIFLVEAGSARLLFVTAHLLFVAGALGIGLAAFGRAGNGIAWAGIVAVLVGIAEKLVNRDQLRQAYLRQVDWDFSHLQTSPQYSVIALFLVTLVAGVACLAWVIARYRREVKTFAG